MRLLPKHFGLFTPRLERIFLILGPCAFEGREHCISIAAAIAEIAQRLDRLVIFKVSFDKANRTRQSSYRGRGMTAALNTFDEVRHKLRLPIITDVHEPSQCALVQDHVDALQIPAFLCRQTDLLRSAGATGLPVNIKKGQFLSPSDMQWATEKVRGGGGRPMACERGTFFGYSDLVNDFRSLSQMRRECMCPVIFDATHSVQKPNSGGVTLGDRTPALDLARAAIAIGVDGLFLETHDNPAKAPSDASSMIPLEGLEAFLTECIELDDFCKEALAQRAAASRAIGHL